MSVKSVVSSESSVKAVKFPKLMVSKETNTVYLMADATTGTVVGNFSNNVGSVYGRLSASCMKDFTGTVTLTNKVAS